MKQGKRREVEKKLENSVELLEGVRGNKFADKEDIWIKNEHGVYILDPF